VKAKHWLIATVVVVLLAAVVRSDYHIYVLSLAGLFSILTVGLNFTMGLCGLTSLGHAAFWGIGAYTAALLLLRTRIPFIVALVVGGLAGGLAGALLGVPSLKVRSFYLAITTIGFNQIVDLILNNWVNVTRGPDGLPGIPSPALGPFILDSPREKYMLIMCCLLLAVWAFSRIKESRVGRAFQAIKDDELAAELMGINIHYYKVLAFALGAAVAAIAGGLYACFIGYVSPDTFSNATSTLIVSMLLVGGPGSVWGAVIGGCLLEVLPEWMRFLRDYYMALYGFVVVIMALRMPGGLDGLFARVADHLQARIQRRQGKALAGKGV